MSGHKLLFWLNFMVVTVTCVLGCTTLQLRSKRVKTILSHNDFNITDYDNNTSACWRIRADGDCNKVQLEADIFRIQPDVNGSCADVLRVYDGARQDENLEGEYCGVNFTYAESDGHVMTVTFTSDAAETESGFRLHARSTTGKCQRQIDKLTSKLAIILGTVIGSAVTIIAIITIVWFVKKKPSNDKVYVGDTRGRSIELGGDLPGYDPRTYSQDTGRSTASSHHVPKLDLFSTPRSPPPKYERTHTSRTSLTSLPRSTARSVLSTRRLSIEDVGQTVHSVRVRKMAGSDSDMEVISHLDNNNHKSSARDMKSSRDIYLCDTE